jgi:hypothetical protein
MQEEPKVAIIKPYNYKGHLDFLLENVCIDDFYVKKQVYDLVFADVAVFFVKMKHENRKYYKLKPGKLPIKKCQLQIDELLSIPIVIDFSLIL